MRSELVFGATHYVGNRYLLVKLAAKAVRAFHRPNTRVAETANDVLLRFGANDPAARPEDSHFERTDLRPAANAAL